MVSRQVVEAAGEGDLDSLVLVREVSCCSLLPPAIPGIGGGGGGGGGGPGILTAELP